jgi:4'-phosphopantetheinyl transferase
MSMPVVWERAANEVELPEDEVHVWRASLQTEPSVLCGLDALLTPEEKSRAARFHFARDRDHFISSRGVLRYLLRSYLKRSAAELEFCYGPQDKPALRTEGLESRIRFNLSHSHGLAVYAFSRCCEVGIDLELIRPDFASNGIAEQCFSPNELRELRALPPELRAEGFFLGWTRKEAYVKARGVGLRIPLDSFSVSLTPGRSEKLLAADSSRWSVHSFQPAPRYVATVVVEGASPPLRYWEWRP